MRVPGFDHADDSDTDDIANWMVRRQQDVADRDQDIAAGREAWTGSTATGDNLQAATPEDLRALGADAQGQDAAAMPPIKQGDKAVLSDDAMARILFGEFRSYSGPKAIDATVNGAHALINADESWGADRQKLAGTHPPVQSIPPAEMAKFREIQQALATAKAQRARGLDPTKGARHFNFRTDDSRGPNPNGLPLHTQVGPLHNSYPYRDVPSPTAWANTYQE